MIFVTVGSDIPFDRLIKAVDRWAYERGRNDVFAQIGETDYQPKHLKYTKFLEPAEFTQRVAESSLIVAHAGMGTILTSLRWRKPILVVPRRTALKEVRNEHQFATANHLHRQGKISVAFDDRELFDKLDNLSELKVGEAIGPYASPQLLDALKQFIHRGTVPAVQAPQPEKSPARAVTFDKVPVA